MKYDVMLDAGDMPDAGIKSDEEAKSKEKEIANAIDEINEIEVDQMKIWNLKIPQNVKVFL
jgi:hypothetical protein